MKCRRYDQKSPLGKINNFASRVISIFTSALSTNVIEKGVLARLEAKKGVEQKALDRCRTLSGKLSRQITNF